MRYGIWRNLPRISQGVRKWDYGRAIKPRAVFIHIMEGHLAGTDGWFRNRASGTVSTHFGIGYANLFDRALRRVSVYQWVDTINTAYGTAVTRYPVSPLAKSILGDLIGRIDVNHGIIHIEVEGYPNKAWPAGFVKALNALLAALGKAHGPLMVMRHNDISSKTCPGFMAPWSQIRPTYGTRLLSVAAPAPPRPPPPPPPPTKEKDLYEWIPQMGHQRPKGAIVAAGTVPLANPGGTPHSKAVGKPAYRFPSDTRIEVIGGLYNQEQFWVGRRSPDGNGLFLIPNARIKSWVR